MSITEHSNNGHAAIDNEQLQKTVKHEQLLALGQALLIAIGEDPERDGLRDTPRRFADAWREFIEYGPGTTDTCFASVSTDQMVCVSGIHVTSICEHHLMAFTCDIAIGYIPGEKVLGLSKFARIAHQYAHRLQLQERLGEQIADEVSRITGSPHIAVVIRGEHLCMSTRGIRTPRPDDHIGNARLVPRRRRNARRVFSYDWRQSARRIRRRYQKISYVQGQRVR